MTGSRGRKYSRLFKAAVRAVAPLVEDRGIDEIYIDVTDIPGAQNDAGRAVGQQLKDAVFEATGLTCSVGITPNKLLSKICSELDKPNGLTLLSQADIPARATGRKPGGFNGTGGLTAEAQYPGQQFVNYLPEKSKGGEIVTSAGSAETKGFELELTAAPSDNFTLNMGIAYVDARFTQGCDADEFILNSGSIRVA